MAGRDRTADSLSSLDQLTLSFRYPPANWKFFDCAYGGGNGPSNGSFGRPHTTLAAALAAAPAGGTIWVLRNCTFPAGNYNNNITIRTAPGITATFGGLKRSSKMARQIERVLLAFVIVLANCVVVLTQAGGTFVIRPSVIANGGGASSGGAFAVTSTIGQPLAGTQSLGGSFSLLSGFWASGAATAPRRAPFDFDGDGKTDLSVFKPGPGEWWYLRSVDGGNRAFQFGASTDLLTPADFTGDGKTDIAFFRPSTGFWFVLRSEDFSFFSFPFGVSSDVPVPADFDGDNKADPAIFRPSNATWFINRSTGGTTIQQFGVNGDRPIAGDYDGDGRADLAIYRPNVAEWWLLRSTAGVVAAQFGTLGDKTAVGDYTGDGKTDVAFWRPSNGSWFVLRSEDFSFFSFPFGMNGDTPAPGDYDGDGRWDPAIFRPTSATWFINRSTGGTTVVGFGSPTDAPIPAAFVR